MKDERTHYGAMDKSLLEQHICVSASIFWPYPPTASGSYSSEGGRLKDKMRVRFELRNVPQVVVTVSSSGQRLQDCCY